MQSPGRLQSKNGVKHSLIEDAGTLSRIDVWKLCPENVYVEILTVHFTIARYPAALQAE